MRQLRASLRNWRKSYLISRLEDGAILAAAGTVVSGRDRAVR